MLARGVASVALGVISAACSVDVELDGKPCPCTDGYACDQRNLVCVPEAGARGDCLVGAVNFRATWATPGSIRWDWDPVGEEQDFAAYRVVTGEHESDVEQAAPPAKIWEAPENPELGVYTLRRTGAEEVVGHTITDGLASGRLYHAELRIVDSAGCEFTSPNMAAKQTTDAQRQVDLMVVDAAHKDWWALGVTATSCFDSDGECWSGTFACDDKETLCFRNFHMAELDVPLVNPAGDGITAGNFPTAYLAFRLDAQVAQQPWWGVVNLNFEETVDIAWGREPFVFRAGGYQLIEIPLSALLRRKDLETVESNPIPLTPADIGQTLDTFALGLAGAPGESIWVDDVWIGW